MSIVKVVFGLAATAVVVLLALILWKRYKASSVTTPTEVPTVVSDVVREQLAKPNAPSVRISTGASPAPPGLVDTVLHSAFSGMGSKKSMVLQ